MGADKKIFLKRTQPISQSQLRGSQKNNQKHTQTSLETLGTRLERLGHKAEASTKELGQQQRRLRPTGSTDTSDRVTLNLPKPHWVTWAQVTGSTYPLRSPGTSVRITRDIPENCPRIRPKRSINGSPKPLGFLRRNFREMMNTPRRSYAPKIMASNTLQLPKS
jgi:hypothetical protein